MPAAIRPASRLLQILFSISALATHSVFPWCHAPGPLPVFPAGYDVIVACPLSAQRCSLPCLPAASADPDSAPDNDKTRVLSFGDWRRRRHSSSREEARNNRRQAWKREHSAASPPDAPPLDAHGLAEADEDGWTVEDREILDRGSSLIRRETDAVRRPTLDDAVDVLWPQIPIPLPHNPSIPVTIPIRLALKPTAPSPEHSSQFSPPQPHSETADLAARFNYASSDCAATVVSSNPETRHASALLTASRDHYMLNKCLARKKWVVIELCEEILVDALQLANFEFFSSSVKDFRISVSADASDARNGLQSPKVNDAVRAKDLPPAAESSDNVASWTTIGQFRAHNNRELQTFRIARPIVWARYFRIDFLSHYGSEYYCPLSLIKVYGVNVMEDLKRDEVNKSTLEREAADADLYSFDVDVDFEEDADDAADDAAIHELDAPERIISELMNKSLEMFDSALAAGAPAKAEQSAGKESTSVDQFGAIASPPEPETAVAEVSQNHIDEGKGTGGQALSLGIMQAFPLLELLGAEGFKAIVSQNPFETLLNKHKRAEVAAVTAEQADPSPDTTVNSDIAAVSTGPVSSLPNDILPTFINPDERIADLVIDISDDAHSHLRSTEKPLALDDALVDFADHNPSSPEPAAQESVLKTLTKRVTALEKNLGISQNFLEDQGHTLKELFGEIESDLDQFMSLVSELDAKMKQATLDAQRGREREALLAETVARLSTQVAYNKYLGLLQTFVLLLLVVLLCRRSIITMSIEDLEWLVPMPWQRLIRAFLAPKAGKFP